MTDTAAPMTPEEIIDGAHLQRRNYTICLAGHLVPKFQQLEAELQDLIADYNPDKPKRVGGRPEKDVKADELEALQAEMDSWNLVVTLEQKPRDVWRDFKAANPPREGEPEDQRTRVNMEAVVTDFVRSCVVDPVLSEERWRRLTSTCAPGDLQGMGFVVYQMHESGLSVPKSRLISAARRMSGDDSERPLGSV